MFLVPCKKWHVRCTVAYNGQITYHKVQKTRSCLSGQVVQQKCLTNPNIRASHPEHNQISLDERPIEVDLYGLSFALEEIRDEDPKLFSSDPDPAHLKKKIDPDPASDLTLIQNEKKIF